MAVIEGRCNDRPRAVGILLTRALAGAVSTLAVLLLARPVAADTRTVTNTLDSGPGSLRQVVLDAVPGDVARFDSTVFSVPLTITLTSGQIEISRSLTIDGAYGGVVTPTISGADTTRILQVDAGVSVTINHVSLVNGYCGSSDSCYGGAVYNDGALNITGSLLFGSRARYGGAIANDGMLTVANSTLMGNMAVGTGGGIYNGPTALLSVIGSMFVGNSARLGGGVISVGVLTVTGSTFVGNSALDRGGGVYIEGINLLLVAQSMFTANQAVNMGGGVAVGKGGIVSLMASRFTANTAWGGAGLSNSGQRADVSGATFDANDATFGSGIYSSGALTVTNGTVAGNTSTSPDYTGGSAVDAQGTPTVILNSTIAGNTTASTVRPMYGLLVWGAHATLQNSIIALNGHQGAENVLLYSGAALTSAGHNLTSSDGPFTATGDLINTNPLLGTLGNYGGPVMTLLLLPGSPAIDAGDDAACPPTDARGVPRPFGAHCDIGAYEANWPLYYLPVIARQ